MPRRDHRVLFHARERRKSILDPTFELFRSQVYLDGATILVADFADYVDRPIAWKIRVRVDDLGTANGVIFEVGTATDNVGTTLWLDGGDLHAGAGENGDTVSIADAFLEDGQVRDIVLAVTSGRIGLWAGELFAFVDVSDAFPWAGTDDGEVGDVSGTAAWVPGPQAVALAGATIESPLSVYRGQFPRQLQR